jgi:hypothetical protein
MLIVRKLLHQKGRHDSEHGVSEMDQQQQDEDPWPVRV